jgi:hypothetical protein
MLSVFGMDVSAHSLDFKKALGPRAVYLVAQPLVGWAGFAGVNPKKLFG